MKNLSSHFVCIYEIIYVYHYIAANKLLLKKITIQHINVVNKTTKKIMTIHFLSRKIFPKK